MRIDSLPKEINGIEIKYTDCIVKEVRPIIDWITKKPDKTSTPYEAFVVGNIIYKAFGIELNGDISANLNGCISSKTRGFKNKFRKILDSILVTNYYKKSITILYSNKKSFKFTISKNESN
jgi:hypothetical protein